METGTEKFVAFLTYNGLGVDDDVCNGVHRSSRAKGSRKALILQNTAGKFFATAGRKSHQGTEASADHGASEVKSEIEKLWKRLKRHLSALDHIVFYLGREGAESALEKVAASFPPEKVTIVSCTCNVEMKKLAVKQVGLEKARFLTCRRCGGQTEILGMYFNYMENGQLEFYPD